jgi:hypothetical protein
MTIRDYLNTQRKKYFGATFISWGISIISLIVMAIVGEGDLLYFILISSFVAGEFFMLSIYWKVCCPNCKNKLGMIFFFYSKKVFSISDKIGFCPYCGINLNSEIEKK